MARIHTFADGDDLSALDATLWSQLLERALPRHATELTWSSWPGDGGLHRVAVVTGLDRGEFLTLDTESDWRDRMIVTVALGLQPADWAASFTGPAYPGSPSDDLNRPAISSLLAVWNGYTGTGRTEAQVSAGTHGYLSPIGSDLAIFADSGDAGILKVWRDSTDASADPESLMLIVLASEQTGERSTPGTHPDLTVTDGEAIEPHVLNGFQDRAMLGQAREVDGGDVDCFPLGPKLDPEGIPELWTIRGAKRRQPVAGMPWRFFYATAADGAEVVVDDSIDWRDRILWGEGRRSTSAIGAGGAAEGSHNAATGWGGARYTGPGETGSMVEQGYSLRIIVNQLQLRVRPTDGALMLYNETGSTQYVTGLVAATFQLGPRTPA